MDVEKAEVAAEKAGSWLANAFIIGGGIIMAVLPAVALKAWVFGLFLTGHIIWVGYAIQRKEKDLLQLNAGMVVLDIYAIWIRMTM